MIGDCRATGATALVKLAAPQPDELGFAKSLALEEIGGTNVVVLQQDASQGQVPGLTHHPVSSMCCQQSHLAQLAASLIQVVKPRSIRKLRGSTASPDAATSTS